jgi:hypothetical protein
MDDPKWINIKMAQSRSSKFVLHVRFWDGLRQNSLQELVSLYQPLSVSKEDLGHTYPMRRGEDFRAPWRQQVLRSSKKTGAALECVSARNPIIQSASRFDISWRNDHGSMRCRTQSANGCHTKASCESTEKPTGKGAVSDVFTVACLLCLTCRTVQPYRVTFAKRTQFAE